MRKEMISRTLEENYLPYAMSVIHSRALPEIDGFKPAHRKLLYTMYSMGLLKGSKTKSANVVGQTMKLNPHGEGAIYATLVRLTRGNENLLYPYIDSKGNFGKVYSRDMQAAASRYTEVKLDEICKYIFEDVDRDRVDFVPNYDGTLYEPLLLPVQFPTILVNPNRGIAVGMASSICSFPMDEVSQAVVALMADKDASLDDIVTGPDFSTGAYVIDDRAVMKKVIEEGQGSFRLRAKLDVIKKENRIEITEIPYTATIEGIIQRIIQLMKEGDYKEISDVRDESDLRGLRIALECRRGTDYEDLVQRLYKETPLEDRFNCNFNILIGGSPMQLGLRGILLYWIDFRMSCIRRGIRYDIEGYKNRLHLLRGLELILLDIDKVIALIRKTPKEKEVVPVLMENFNLDQTQAEYVANIRLRQINKEVIEARLQEIDSLEREIKNQESLYKSDKKIYKLIEKQLGQILKEFAQPRKTKIIEAPQEYIPKESVKDKEEYTLILTKENYIKKISKKELDRNYDMRLKEGDEIVKEFPASEDSEILAFTSNGNVYKAYVDEIEESKSGDLGIYLAGMLELEEEENIVFISIEENFEGSMLFAFEDGRLAKIDMSSYKTKARRKKLLGAYYTGERLVAILRLREDRDLVLYRYMNQKENILLINTSLISSKKSRISQGVQVLRTGKHGRLMAVEIARGSKMEKYRSKTIPSSGSPHKEI